MALVKTQQRWCQLAGQMQLHRQFLLCQIRSPFLATLATFDHEPSPPPIMGWRVPIDRLAELAPKCIVSGARVVDSGRIITGGGVSSGMEVRFHLLRRAGYGEDFIAEVARVMEYSKAYE